MVLKAVIVLRAVWTREAQLKRCQRGMMLANGLEAIRGIIWQRIWLPSSAHDLRTCLWLS